MRDNAEWFAKISYLTGINLFDADVSLLKALNVTQLPCTLCISFGQEVTPTSTP